MFIKIQFLYFLALMQGKSLAFFLASFGKAAGKWITDKSRTIRSYFWFNKMAASLAK
jgi:hypothetical protein